MSNTITKATMDLENRALKYLDSDYFTCTAHQAPECTGRGFLVGKGQGVCSPCLNWRKREEQQRLERGQFSFVEVSR